MNILTTENRALDINSMPDESDDIRFCVLDYSDHREPDYFFIPLMFLENFSCPAMVLEIGNKYKIQMPLDWSVLVTDANYSDIEIMPLTALNDRNFHTMVWNPLKHMVPVPLEVVITNVYTDVKWFTPKLPPGNILVVPLEDGPCPPCALFVRDTSKLPDVIDIGTLFE